MKYLKALMVLNNLSRLCSVSTILPTKEDLHLRTLEFSISQMNSKALLILLMGTVSLVSVKEFFVIETTVQLILLCRYDKPVKGRKINWMKAGILESDKVLTVSPYYAQELVSGVEKGVELDNILRKTGIMGIVNGMDVQEWNPLSDKYLSVKYDASTVRIFERLKLFFSVITRNVKNWFNLARFLEFCIQVMDAKPLLKEALQAEVGLPVDRNIPVIGFIGRLEEQKGSDILVAAIPQFIRENVQIVVLVSIRTRSLHSFDHDITKTASIF